MTSETKFGHPGNKFGHKVKAYPNIEDARVGFVVNGEPDTDGKYGVQVGSDVFALSHDEEAAEGKRGGTFRSI